MNGLGQKRIGIVILAAGGSKRLGGEPKQLLEFQGETLLRNSLEAAMKLEPSSTIIVLGYRERKLRSQLKGLPVRIAVNAAWESGMSSSIKSGLSAVSEEDVDAALFMLCDQPLVSVSTLELLRNTFLEMKKPIIASRYESSIGVPALFSREVFDEFADLQGDDGAKKLIVKDPSRVFAIDVPEAGFDIDTMDDYKRLNKYKAGTSSRATAFLDKRSE